METEALSDQYTYTTYSHIKLLLKISFIGMANVFRVVTSVKKVIGVSQITRSLPVTHTVFKERHIRNYFKFHLT